MNADRTPPSPAANPDHTAAKATPGKPADGFADEEKEDGPWRHAPVAPKDEGIAASIGKSIVEVVTGPVEDAAGKPKTP